MPLNGIPNSAVLQMESVWLDANRYHEAEAQYHELQAQGKLSTSHIGAHMDKDACPKQSKVKLDESATPASSLVSEIVLARQKIQNFLKASEGESDVTCKLHNRVLALESEKTDLKQRLSVVEGQMEEMFQKVLRLDSSMGMDKLKYIDNAGDVLKKCIQSVDTAVTNSLKVVPDLKILLEGKGISPETMQAFEEEKKKAVVKIIKILDETMSNCCQISASNKEVKVDGQKMNNGPADDDDVDLFGSDEETEEEVRVREERLKAYATKKSKKPALVAKSSVVLDVKPWSDETDMKELEKGVKKIEMDGLLWGASKLIPVAFNIKKLQIVAIVEDDKVSIDALQESIEELEDLVQSVDIAAFNKL